MMVCGCQVRNICKKLKSRQTRQARSLSNSFSHLELKDEKKEEKKDEKKDKKDEKKDKKDEKKDEKVEKKDEKKDEKKEEKKDETKKEERKDGTVNLNKVKELSDAFNILSKFHKPGYNTQLTGTQLSSEIPLEQFQPPRVAFDVLAAEYDALRKECNELADKYKRALAETENVRRRGQKQVEDAKVFAIQSFCKDLLEVADVLNLALESVKKEDLDKDPDLKNLYVGVNMTNTVLQKAFVRHGLKPVSPEGEKFDPNLHDAVFQVPTEATKHAPGHITEVMKIGYYLHNRPI